MSSDETVRELERLRAEVAALSSTRRDAVAEPEAATRPSQETVAPPDETAGEPASDSERSQFEELGALLEAEIRELPTVTCLVVFSLGIIMGRLMR